MSREAHIFHLFLLGSLSLSLFCAGGCGSSVKPLRLQKTVDEARVLLQAAEAAAAPELAGEEYRKAERLLAEAIRQQQKGRHSQSYYLALRAQLQGDVARATAEASQALQRLELARQGYIEARLEEASLRVETAEALQKIAEIYRARAEADATLGRREAAAAHSSATTTQREAMLAVERAHAEAELDKAQFLLDLALEADATTYDREGHAEMNSLLTGARQLFDAGDYRAARLKAMDAYRVANETRLTALTKRDAERQQKAQERLNNTARAVLEIGKATAILEIAQKTGAERQAREAFQRADATLKQALTAQRNESYDEAARLGAQAQLLAEEARLATLQKLEQIRSQREREERIALVKDTLVRVQRAKESLDDFTRKLSGNQLASVDGMVRLAEKSLQDGNIVVAGVNADRAEALIQEAIQYAKDAKAAEADILEKAKGIENVQAFTTERGTVIRLAGDLFPVGRSDLNTAFFPSIAKITQALSPYASNYRIVVEGHTDRSGDSAVNLRLSKARAATFARHLIEFLGGPAVRVTSEGYGDTQPILNLSPSDPKNRRIEVVVLTGERP